MWALASIDHDRLALARAHAKQLMGVVIIICGARFSEHAYMSSLHENGILFWSKPQNVARKSDYDVRSYGKSVEHGPAWYKMDRIYIHTEVRYWSRAKLSSLTKNLRMSGSFWHPWFWLVQLVLINFLGLTGLDLSRKSQIWHLLGTKFYYGRDFWGFVMYYIYGSVWAIPTYRVYRLYDI